MSTKMAATSHLFNICSCWKPPLMASFFHCFPCTHMLFPQTMHLLFSLGRCFMMRYCYLYMIGRMFSVLEIQLIVRSFQILKVVAFSIEVICFQTFKVDIIEFILLICSWKYIHICLFLLTTWCYKYFLDLLNYLYERKGLCLFLLKLVGKQPFI